MDLPVLTVELKADLGSGEQGLVDLSFKDLQVHFDKSHMLETNIQVLSNLSIPIILSLLKVRFHYNKFVS